MKMPTLPEGWRWDTVADIEANPVSLQILSGGGPFYSLIGSTPIDSWDPYHLIVRGEKLLVRVEQMRSSKEFVRGESEVR